MLLVAAEKQSSGVCWISGFHPSNKNFALCLGEKFSGLGLAEKAG
jgi:nitroreductase